MTMLRLLPPSLLLFFFFSLQTLPISSVEGAARSYNHGYYYHPYLSADGGDGYNDTLPDKSFFPGPWEKYIKAPETKEKIEPRRILKVKGNVSTSAVGDEVGWRGKGVVPLQEGAEWISGGRRKNKGKHEPGEGILIGEGGWVSLEFGENIAGRVCIDVEAVSAGATVEVELAYTESPWYAGPVPDATTDRQARDIPLPLKITRKGETCVGKDFVRGAFKYLTVHLPSAKPREDAVAGDGEEEQKVMWPRRKKKWVSIRNVWVNCTAFPSQKNGRAYSGYFYSSNEMLNRIWYSGAWTLQLSTIDPKEGGALIDFNRIVDGNDSPIGSWYSNFTISNGTAVTTDGAKRDRMVYPGDMFVAVPGIAVSTFDMAAVRNALEVLFDHQYGDGSLPYAGPPMGLHGEFSDTYHMHTLLGVYHYVLYSGDVEWLRKRWEAYQRALKISVDKVDKMGLMHVSSTADWLRPGMTGHNLEATSILYTVLDRSKLLAQWVGQPGDSRELNIGLTAVQKRLENGVARLYCPASGLFADNIGERGCLSPKGPVLPQDGNSWVLLSNMDLSPCRYPWKDPKSPFRSNHTLKNAPTRKEVSNLLRGRWTKYGAPAVEFPNTISPFASSFELLGHVYAGNEDYAVELMLVEWGYLLDGPGFTNSTLAEGFRIDGHMQYPAYWSAARNSHTHGWSAGPTGVLMEYILGIRLLAPGGTSWVYYGGLTVWLSSVQGGFHGTKDRWWQLKKWRVTTKSGDKKGVVAEVTAPAGTEGRISLGDEELKVVGNGQPKIFVRMEGDGESIQSIDIKQKTVTVEGGENTEDWYQNIVLTMDDGTELLFDTDWKEPEVEEREVGVVDWEVMEKHFKTPPPEGWRMDRLRVQGDEW